MLRYMRIRDFALIRDLAIDFDSGLNLLTGETGSGKSILVDALGLLVGGRASQEMVRAGSEQAVLEGLFSLDPSSEDLRAVLTDGGVACDEGQVLVRREISAAGRNRIFVNNTVATLAFLKSIGMHLADIHGQHDHQSLLQVSTHLDFLDRFGDNADRTRELGARHRRIREISDSLDAITLDEQERLQRIDILQYQVEEIDRIAPREGERESLEEEKRLLLNRERLHGLASELYALIYDSEGSMLAGGARSLRILEELESVDARWAPHREAVAEVQYKLEDAAYFARDYVSAMDIAPGRLDEVERRLAELERLGRKYGPSTREILEHGERCRSELEALESHKDRAVRLEKELEQARSEYRAGAEALTERRHKDARRLEREIRAELSRLSMEGTTFKVEFQMPEEGTSGARVPSGWGPKGWDRVEFLFSSNKGEDPRPLAKIASGGELSRLVLCLKTLCGGEGPGKTLVFDEVDAGIGGRVAEVLGRRLRDISRQSQVLCVTHLAPIAAFAHHHFRVLKEPADGRTETRAERLEETERVEELARMMGGEVLTETARTHAREMLARSQGAARARSS